MNEDDLRDLLASQLEKLEPGLALIKKEQFVPNSLGTRGFIDLFARDAQNHFVLIELKRSGPASREALHEVLKYVEGVKAHLGAREHEIRAFIVSTDWSELLVPFSRFVADSTIAIRGYKISIGRNNKISIVDVAPLKSSQGRLLAPWHELNFYKSEVDLQRGIREYEACCKKKNIQDFVIVVLDPPTGFNEAAKDEFRLRMREIAFNSGETPDDQRIDELAKKLDDYFGALYFAMQMLDRDACLRIIANDKERASEAEEILPGMEEEEALSYLHESVYACRPTPYRNSYEIGYPAKFQSRLLNQEGWKIRKIRRFGVFSRNNLLTDDAITEELSGSEGTTGQRFKRRISIANVAHVSSARASIGECLKENDLWREQVLRALKEIEERFPNSEVEISIFNPAAGLVTLFFAMMHERGLLYVPSYHLTIHDGTNVRCMYHGCLVDIGGGISFQKIIKKYYEGNLFGFLFTFTWGGRESRDTAILADLGLVYRSFRCEIKGNKRKHFAWRDDAWKPIKRFNPLGIVFEFLSKRPELTADIALEIGSRWNGGLIQDDSVGEHKLRDLVDLKEGKRRKLFWIGEIKRCDLCGHDFENDKYMVDGATAPGSWANMCARCFEEQKAEIGWGKGQLYLRNGGRWLLVAGFGPEDEEG
jgi:hypothetical protein